ncbi:MAG: iron-sulfur cluster assembly accessory protein [Candidatus Sericytochromatia bacterium]|nr:iron-sulfur cluster assembly accessory protein [Candidatus Sericytochromatia bacterium]
MVFVTEKAAEEIKRTLEKEENKDVSVRLSVQGGGCSGLSYKLSYDQVKEKDHQILIHGVTVLVDRKSAIYLKGMTLDFNDSLSSRGFVFVNPNATNTCGCGESFSV